MTNPIQRLLMEAIEEDNQKHVFSASNTDFYHLTTGQVLWRSMMEWSNTGNMVLRGDMTTPYTVIAGLRHIVEALADFRFDGEFIGWAKAQTRPDGQRKFDPDYLDGLAGMPFACTLEMMPDGSVAFPGPIGRVTGDPVQAKWIDTIISDFLRRGSSIATKAARLKWIADKAGISLADNAFRRSNDTGGLLTAEIAVMVGLVGTSHMRAAMVNDLKPIGTMDHWYVMLKMAEYFGLNRTADTQDPQQQRRAQQHAFRSYMQEHPDYNTLLIDTISLDTGIEDAIIVLKEFNPQHYGLRIDSGDLAKGTAWCNRRLREEGLKHITISLSGGLRAVNLESLWKDGVDFTAAGIGEYFQYGGERQRKSEDLYESPVNVEIVTKVGYAETPDGVGFRLIKLSETAGKASRPGILDRWRFIGAGDSGQECLLADVEVDLTLPYNDELIDNVLTRPLNSLRLETNKKKPIPAGTAFERPIVTLLKGPELVDPDVLGMAASHERFVRQFALLPDNLKRVDGGHSANPVGIESDHYFMGLQMATNEQVVSPV